MTHSMIIIKIYDDHVTRPKFYVWNITQFELRVELRFSIFDTIDSYDTYYYNFINLIVP